MKHLMEKIGLFFSRGIVHFYPSIKCMYFFSSAIFVPVVKNVTPTSQKRE